MGLEDVRGEIRTQSAGPPKLALSPATQSPSSPTKRPRSVLPRPFIPAPHSLRAQSHLAALEGARVGARAGARASGQDVPSPRD